MLSSGLAGSDTSIGAWRPGDAPMFGSQISTSKPFSAPSSWMSASMSTIDWWRNPPARPVTSTL